MTMQPAMIRFVRFLVSCGIPINFASYKIHLATSNRHPPLEAFFAGKFKEWQENQTRRNFPCDMVIGLIEFEKNRWLFAGVYKVLGVKAGKNGRYRYQTELLPGQEALLGRAIVYHKRSGRASYLRGKKDGGEFYLSELRPEPLSVHEFPGYHSVTVSHSLLRVIISQDMANWRGALSNIKGVYLIADQATGRLYVGSATAGDGIWQRWNAYVSNGHGGNLEMREVIREKGFSHAENFQYSILEIADSHASDGYVLERESYWKTALLSRRFGYNKN